MRGRDVIWSHYGEKINKVSITNLVPNLVPILLPSKGGVPLYMRTSLVLYMAK